MMRPKPPRGVNRGRKARLAEARGDDAVELRPRIESLLGFAVKSGRVIPGYELTRQGLARGDVAFVLAARDLAPRRLEALARDARERGIGMLVDWTRLELGGLLDRGSTGAAGITDRSLARGMHLWAVRRPQG